MTSSHEPRVLHFVPRVFFVYLLYCLCLRCLRLVKNDKCYVSLQLMVRVLFFGELRDVTGCGEYASESSADSKMLVAEVLEKWPMLRGRTFSLAVNRKVQSENVPLKSGDEIALMPPFSGG